jgi:uncharacterized protein YceK
MKIYIRLLAIYFVLFLFSGCATIIKGGGPQGVHFKSEPADAKLTVIDLRNGNVMANVKTPQVVLLPKGAGYFKYAKYNATFEKEGYDKKEVNLESDVSMWYVAGNLLFGGLIGYLIVDPATGAMWHFDPEQVSVLLNPKGTADPIGFNIDEFKPPLSVEKLCAVINADKYEIQFREPDNTITRLNEILEVTDLFNKISAKDKLPKKGSEVSLPPDINELKNQTATYRDASAKFIGLNFDQQAKIRKLNRRLLEVTYSNETPKK